MVYLDYSATTPVNEEVLDTFCKVSKNYIGNMNSLHRLGVESKKLGTEATNQIARLLNVKTSEIIYTSGASEANNLIIKGLIGANLKRGKQIITTQLEHSSILEPLLFLKQYGYQIDYVSLLEDGTVDLEHLKSLMSSNTVLVTIASVSSELGVLQPISEIAKIVKQYPKCYFHSDMTQSIGKINISLEDIDAISFSAHKFYGLKGIGCLVKKENMNLVPLIHGGESMSVFRSGTPALPLIVATSKALRLALTDLNQKYEMVNSLNKQLVEELLKINEIELNSTSKSIPHIINISVKDIKPETLLHALEEKEIYLSTKSACSSHKKESLSVETLYHDKKRASSTLRISISHLTTKEEVAYFISCLKECIVALTIR